ncbi:hypothetical protein LPJ73_001662, partial [Coemansia sp. RSA 2703]
IRVPYACGFAGRVRSVDSGCGRLAAAQAGAETGRRGRKAAGGVRAATGAAGIRAANAEHRRRAQERSTRQRLVCGAPPCACFDARQRLRVGCGHFGQHALAYHRSQPLMRHRRRRLLRL